MRITYIISLTFRLGFVRLPYPFGVCALLQVCYAAAEKSGGMSTTGAHGSGEESGKADLGKSAGPDLGVRTARRGNLARNTPPDLGPWRYIFNVECRGDVGGYYEFCRYEACRSFW